MPCAYLLLCLANYLFVCWFFRLRVYVRLPICLYMLAASQAIDELWGKVVRTVIRCYI